MADLSRISRASGALAMVAVDQREALRGMFAAHQSAPVPDSQLTKFKVDVARELTPYASALLVDQEFGLDAIVEQGVMAIGSGLIAAADLLIGPAGGAATDTAVDPDVDPNRMRDIGAAGLKFLVLWRKDESAESRLNLVNQFKKYCEIAKLPSIIEIIVKAPQDNSIPFDREAQIIEAAKEASTWKPDLYKAEVPFHGEGDHNLIRKNSELISEAIGGPWVVLSNGVKQEFFAEAVKSCCQGGASGFLAGRAVWADIVSSPDIPKALQEVSVPRLKRLSEIVDQYAKPWNS
jgi:sulfofructosephosphate aldolase